MTAPPPGPDSVRAAVAALRDLLGSLPPDAASSPAMGITVVDVVGHVADCLAFFAHDLVAGRS